MLSHRPEQDFEMTCFFPNMETKTVIETAEHSGDYPMARANALRELKARAKRGDEDAQKYMENNGGYDD